MNLDELRVQIDDIDRQMVDLFVHRMEVCEQIGRYKKEHNLPTGDSRRERDKLVEVSGLAPEELQTYVRSLYAQLFELSRSWQDRLILEPSPLCARIEAALRDTPAVFPAMGSIACQGVEGSYSQQAAERLFSAPSILFFHTFESVFSAIDSGLCDYGVLPLENSTAGSVNQIYDLMMRYRFHIVRSVRLKVDHSLLALPGARLEDIREVFSHEQAIAQCAGFFKAHPEIHATVCPNTAAAAQMVAQSGRTDAAALASSVCAKVYGLKTLASGVQDQGNNFTRFICISKTMRIFPGADRTSVMLTTPHRPGSLFRVLSRINALGINLTKLESRPLPDRNFEFMFYFDLETPVYSPQLIQLINELDHQCDSFAYLGSYSEVV